MTDVNSEVAKATGQIAVDTVADGRRALAAIFGDAAAEFALLLSDQVKLWRFKNLLHIQDQVVEIAKQRGLSRDQLRALPLGESLRVANAASDEDQPEVQALWARLIANATSDTGSGIERVYIDLLKSLSPSEVTFLDLLWRMKASSSSSLSMAQYDALSKEIAESSLAKMWLSHSEEKRHVAVQNLQRLRCIAPPPPRRDPFLLDRTSVQGDYGFQSIRTLNVDRVEEHFRAMNRYLHEAVGGDSVHRTSFGLGIQPEWQTYALTSLGEALMRACKEDPDVAPAD